MLPTTLRMFVSMRAEKLWCSTCVSNNTQPQRPGWGLRAGGGRVFNNVAGGGLWDGGKRDSGGLDVMWKEISVKSMLLYVGIWCQYTRLSVMHHSPDSNTCNADLV